MTMITTRSSLQTPKQTSGWKLYKVVNFETNIFPSDVRETAKIRNTNYDLGIPKNEISEGDHHGTEYFEADDKRDLIKKEEEDDSKEKEKLKLRLYKKYKTHML